MEQKWRADPSESSDQTVLAALGARLAGERLRRNLTQEALAEEAGVSRATVRRLETGHSTQLANLVRILRALGRLDDLEALAPEPPVRPLEELERGGRARRRASRPADDAAREAPERRPWRWGEDR